MSEVSFSDTEWKYLVHAQQKLEDDEEQANEEMATILAHLNQYKKQKKLLCCCAGDFITCDIEEIKELERLEENECQAHEEQETLLKQWEEVAAKMQQLAAVSDNPSLTQIMNSPSFWSDLGLSAGDIPSSCYDNLPSAQ